MSRQISEDAAHAFTNSRDRNLGNTAVVVDDYGWTYLSLHGNRIARFRTEEGWWRSGEIRTCGWAGRTTNDRLNALPGVEMWGHHEVWLHGFPWEDGHEWTPFHGGSLLEKCGPVLHDQRTTVNEFLEGFGYRIRKRHGQHVHAKSVSLGVSMIEGKVVAFNSPHGHDWVAKLTVVYQPWARKPRGEVFAGHLDSAIRKDDDLLSTFSCWKHFADAITSAADASAPDLHKLARVASED